MVRWVRSGLYGLKRYVMKVIWTVTPVGYQRIAKRCPSCSVKRDFTPSGAFRVNSQRRYSMSGVSINAHTAITPGISPCSHAYQSAKLTAIFIAGWWRMMLPRCNILLMTTRSWSETMLNYRGSLIFTFRNDGWSVSPPTSRSVLASGFPVLFRSACCRFWRSNSC